MEGRQMSGLKIIGLGRALPKKKVHNDDLAQMMETSDGFLPEPGYMRDGSARMTRVQRR